MSVSSQRGENGEEGRSDGAAGAGSRVSGAVRGEESAESGGAPNNESSNTDSQDGEYTDSMTGASTGVVYTSRFKGFILLFTALFIVGLITLTPAAIAAAGTLLVFITAAILNEPVDPSEHLTATYTTTPTHPRPGDVVTVTVTVENTSEHTFTDLRVIDTIPDSLRVVTGTPRQAKPLRPGDSLTLTYGVIADRGTYTFGPLNARSRTVFGSLWVQNHVQATESSTTTFRCAVTIDDIPLEEQATQYIGQLLGVNTGDGIEFHSTREYTRGDPPSRINWRALAKRGELSTVAYRKQQTANVTIITDARVWSRVNAADGDPSAATLAAYTAYQLTAGLTQHGHYVGLVTAGLPPNTGGSNPSAFPYRKTNHGNSTTQKQHAFTILDHIESQMKTETYTQSDTAPLRELGSGNFHSQEHEPGVFDIDPYQVTVKNFTHQLTTWAGKDTQFVFITPLLDDGAQNLCTHLHRSGHPITVISPDVTTSTRKNTAELTSNTQHTIKHSETAINIPRTSQRVLSLQRAIRVESLRQTGIPVIDWHPTTPLAVACEKQTRPENT